MADGKEGAVSQKGSSADAGVAIPSQSDLPLQGVEAFLSALAVLLRLPVLAVAGSISTSCFTSCFLPELL